MIVSEPRHEPCIKDLTAADLRGDKPFDLDCVVRKSGAPSYETTVRSKKPPPAVTKYELAQPELKVVPGTFGDPLRVVQRARDMLWLNRNRSNRIITGNTRRGEQFWVYGRAGEPCRRCGTPIERDDSGDRIRFWCPNCQAI